MVLEGYLSSLLMNYVSKYIKNIKPQDLNLSLWDGDVVLRKLDLKLDVLEEELNLPFKFLNGHIHELKIRIPWMSLGSESVSVIISTIEFSLSLKSSLHSDRNRATSRATRKALADQKQLAESTQKGTVSRSYTQSMINKIINNINIQVNNLILKYVEEDIVFSLNFTRLHLYTVNEEWKSSFVDVTLSDFVLRRVCEVSDLTVCLDKRNASGVIENYQEPIIYKLFFDVRIYKVFHPNMKIKSIKASLFVHEVNVKLSEIQLPMFVRLIQLYFEIYYGTLELPTKDKFYSSDVCEPLPSDVSLTIPEETSSDAHGSEHEENAGAADNSQGWIPWAWSYVPSMWPDEEEFQESTTDIILNIGFYCSLGTFTFTPLKCSKDSSFPNALLQLTFEGCCYEVTTFGIPYLNVIFGISCLTGNLLGTCPCGLIDEPKFNFLRIGRSLNNNKYLSESLFDVRDTINLGETTDVITNANLFFEKYTEEFMFSRFGAICSTYTYQLQRLNETDSIQYNPTERLLPYPEQSWNYMLIGPVTCVIKSGLVHRLLYLLKFINKVKTDYDPYSVPKELKPDPSQRDILEEEFSMIQTSISRRFLHVKIFSCDVSLSLTNHLPLENSVAYQCFDYFFKPLPCLRFIVKEISFQRNKMMYPERIISLLNTLPHIDNRLFEQCFVNYNFNVGDLKLYICLFGNSGTQTIDISSGLNLHGTFRQLLLQNFWKKRNVPSTFLILEAPSFQLYLTKPQFLLLSLFAIHNSLIQSQQNMHSLIQENALLSDCFNHTFPKICFQFLRLYVNFDHTICIQQYIFELFSVEVFLTDFRNENRFRIIQSSPDDEFVFVKCQLGETNIVHFSFGAVTMEMSSTIEDWLLYSSEKILLNSKTTIQLQSSVDSIQKTTTSIRSTIENYLQFINAFSIKLIIRQPSVSLVLNENSKVLFHVKTLKLTSNDESGKQISSKQEGVPWSFSVDDVSLKHNVNYVLSPSSFNFTIAAFSKLKDSKYYFHLNTHMDFSEIQVNLDIFTVHSLFSQADYFMLVFARFILSCQLIKNIDLTSEESVSFRSLPSEYSISQQEASITASDSLLYTENVRPCVWIQSTMSKFKIVFESIDKLVYTLTFDDICSSLDVQTVFQHVKIKIAAISFICSVDNSPSRDIVSNKFCFDTPIKFNHEKTSERTSVMNMNRFSIKNDTAVNLTFTRALSKAVQSKMKKLVFDNESFLDDHFLKEFCITTQPFDIVVFRQDIISALCTVKKFESLSFQIFNLPEFKSKLPSRPIELVCVKTLPLINIDIGTFRLFYVSSDDSSIDNCCLLQFNSLIFKSSASNPVERSLLKENLFRQAVQSGETSLPGSDIEDRQYELVWSDLAFGTLKWSSISGILDELVRLTNFFSSESTTQNPAFEWNYSKRCNNVINTLSITPVLLPLSINGIFAPAIIFQRKSAKRIYQTTVCGHSCEISLKEKVALFLNSSQCKLFNETFENLSALSSKTEEGSSCENVDFIRPVSKRTKFTVPIESILIIPMLDIMFYDKKTFFTPLLSLTLNQNFIIFNDNQDDTFVKMSCFSFKVCSNPNLELDNIPAIENYNEVLISCDNEFYPKTYLYKNAFTIKINNFAFSPEFDVEISQRLKFRLNPKLLNFLTVADHKSKAASFPSLNFNFSVSRCVFEFTDVENCNVLSCGFNSLKSQCVIRSDSILCFSQILYAHALYDTSPTFLFEPVTISVNACIIPLFLNSHLSTKLEICTTLAKINISKKELQNLLIVLKDWTSIIPNNDASTMTDVKQSNILPSDCSSTSHDYLRKGHFKLIYTDDINRLPAAEEVVLFENFGSNSSLTWRFDTHRQISKLCVLPMPFHTIGLRLADDFHIPAILQYFDYLKCEFIPFKLFHIQEAELLQVVSDHDFSPLSNVWRVVLESANYSRTILPINTLFSALCVDSNLNVEKIPQLVIECSSIIQLSAISKTIVPSELNIDAQYIKNIELARLQTDEFRVVFSKNLLKRDLTFHTSLSLEICHSFSWLLIGYSPLLKVKVISDNVGLGIAIQSTAFVCEVSQSRYYAIEQLNEYLNSGEYFPFSFVLKNGFCKELELNSGFGSVCLSENEMYPLNDNIMHQKQICIRFKNANEWVTVSLASNSCDVVLCDTVTSRNYNLNVSCCKKRRFTIYTITSVFTFTNFTPLDIDVVLQVRNVNTNVLISSINVTVESLSISSNTPSECSFVSVPMLESYERILFKVSLEGIEDSQIVSVNKPDTLSLDFCKGNSTYHIYCNVSPKNGITFYPHFILSHCLPFDLQISAIDPNEIKIEFEAKRFDAISLLGLSNSHKYKMHFYSKDGTSLSSKPLLMLGSNDNNACPNEDLSFDLYSWLLSESVDFSSMQHVESMSIDVNISHLKKTPKCTIIKLFPKLLFVNKTKSSIIISGKSSGSWLSLPSTGQMIAVEDNKLTLYYGSSLSLVLLDDEVPRVNWSSGKACTDEVTLQLIDDKTVSFIQNELMFYFVIISKLVGCSRIVIIKDMFIVKNNTQYKCLKYLYRTINKSFDADVENFASSRDILNPWKLISLCSINNMTKTFCLLIDTEEYLRISLKKNSEEICFYDDKFIHVACVEERSQIYVLINFIETGIIFHNKTSYVVNILSVTKDFQVYEETVTDNFPKPVPPTFKTALLMNTTHISISDNNIWSFPIEIAHTNQSISVEFVDKTLFLSMKRVRNTFVISLLETEFNNLDSTDENNPLINVTLCVDQNIVCFQDERFITNKHIEIFRLNVEGLNARFSKLASGHESVFDLSVDAVQVDNCLAKTTKYFDFPVVFALFKGNLDKALIIKGKAIFTSPIWIESMHFILGDGGKCFVEDRFITQLIGYVESFNLTQNDSHLVDENCIKQQSHTILPIEYLYVSPIFFKISLHLSLKMFISINSTPVSLKSFKTVNIAGILLENLINELGVHYASGLLFKAGLAVGSLDLIASPVHFWTEIQAGVMDLFVLPYKGLTKGPASFATGLAYGSGSCAKHVSSGALGSLVNMCLSMSRNLDRISLDSSHSDLQDELRRDLPEHLASGFGKGLTAFGLGLLGAVAGIVNLPMQNIQDLGEDVTPRNVATGLLSGVSKAMVGMVTKPLGGAVELVAQTSQGLMHSMGISQHLDPKFESTSTVGSSPSVAFALQYHMKDNINGPIYICIKCLYMRNGTPQSVVLALTLKHVLIWFDGDVLPTIYNVESLLCTPDPVDSSLLNMKFHENDQSSYSDLVMKFVNSSYQNVAIDNVSQSTTNGAGQSVEAASEMSFTMLPLERTQFLGIFAFVSPE